jgi:hypothetical protein
MELKEILAQDNFIRIEYRNGNSEFVSADALYQSIKQRLIEELRTETAYVGLKCRLIDTTKPAGE